MRVLHWYSDCAFGGGVSRAVYGLAAAQARAGAEVVVAAATPPGPGPLSAPPGVALRLWKQAWQIRVGTFRFRVMSRSEQARAREMAPDVVHIHGEFNPSNLWVPQLFGCPIVLSPHGGFHPVVLRKSKLIGKRLYFGLAGRILYRRARVFHALCPAEEAHIRALLPDALVYCVPQGPGLEAVSSAELPSPNPEPPAVQFLYAGRLDPFTKGLDLLLEAFRTFVDVRPRSLATLLLVGPDWKGGRVCLEQRAGQLGIEKRVVFAGCLSGDALLSAYTTGSVYVQPSRHDGFPLSVVEALLAGNPAIVSDRVGVASFPEIAGLPQVRTVEPQQEAIAGAMAEFADRFGELQREARNAREPLKTFFCWDRIASQHLRQYQRLRENGQ